MSIIDISEKDKINFKCFKFNDGSIYYGEVGWLDQLNNIVKTLFLCFPTRLKLTHIAAT